MKTILKLLRSELAAWKRELQSERRYFKGEYKHKLAIKNLARCKKHIAELEKAIEILKK